MPNIYIHGHFAVISSTAGNPKWFTKTGMSCGGKKRVALLEIYPEKVKYIQDKHEPSWSSPSLKIDQRLKAIKQIVILSDTFFIHNRKGWFAHSREWNRLFDLAIHFERLWPLHTLAKKWPLPPVDYAP